MPSKLGNSLGKFLEKRNLDLGTSQISQEKEIGDFPQEIWELPRCLGIPLGMSQEKEYGNFPNSLFGNFPPQGNLGNFPRELGNSPDV